MGIFTFFVLKACNSVDHENRQRLMEYIDRYEQVVLSADLSGLPEAERKMIPYLISAAEIIDDIFWLQSYGKPGEHLMDIFDCRYARDYALINYGPWGRLEGHTAFYSGFDNKPPGAAFYPADMQREEFDAWNDPDKSNPFTMIRRKEDGSLVSVPYSTAFSDHLHEAADILQHASNLADYKPMAIYLEQLAEALLKDDYLKSDYAWMQMKNNNIDLVMRPLDTGEDRMFGYKAAYSTYLLVKDHEWSARLERFSGLAPALKERLPVAQTYRNEIVADDSEIFVYDAIYYAGHCNAGPKIIALHMPRCHEVQQITGTRNLQLKNVMEAKFHNILKPIGDVIIHEDQRDYISADAFFLLAAFHEIAASLGIRNMVSGDGTVRDALREHHNIIEATATDLMALYFIAQMAEMGEISVQEMHEAYITSFASIIRSSRFGMAGAHGVAGMIRFNFFERENVFTRCEQTFTFRVNIDNMKAAVEKALRKLLLMQGDGNYIVAMELIQRDGSMSASLRKSIERINRANIPVDVIFKQGSDYLDL